METRNILVIGTWVFVLAWLVGMLVTDSDLLVALFLFFVAIMISLVATILPSSSSHGVTYNKSPN